MKRLYGQSLVALALIVIAHGASGQTEQEIPVPLTDSSLPVTLEVSAVFAGSITVVGHDSDELLVAMLDGPQRIDTADERESRGGLRRIPNTSMGLSIEEQDNTVSVRVNSRDDAARLRVSVPRRTSVRIDAVKVEEVTVEGVSGEHELSSVNGSITATELSGTAVVSTTNGDVTISLLELTPDTAMSFASFNGDVDVSLPADLDADLHITTNRGDIFTDFDVAMEPQQAIVEQSDDGSRYQVRVEREVRATVGGGGPEIRFKTFNGDIIIRAR